MIAHSLDNPIYEEAAGWMAFPTSRYRSHEQGKMKRPESATKGSGSYASRSLIPWSVRESLGPAVDTAVLNYPVWFAYSEPYADPSYRT